MDVSNDSWAQSSANEMFYILHFGLTINIFKKSLKIEKKMKRPPVEIYADCTHLAEITKHLYI